ncbi:MAG: DUF87 domain-containing protein [Helicobacteraceae bacterium]|jgi:hypothetical protein|nr:DUF87 domain-containing protein [Helicobacteraceae bacterium]
MSGFYLGKTTDGSKLELDPKTFLTHAAIIGMTGSGKTGLGIALLEEALLAGVSAIAIDPKGDLANLFLTFPNLSKEEFVDWSDDPAQSAAEWKEGLAKWGLDGDRIRTLKNSAEFKLFTPGASHGAPINALGSFAAPSETVLEDSDLLNSLIASCAQNLLGLVNVGAEAASKEATLLTAIIGNAWANGEDLDLEKIIARIVKPPFDKVGVFALESFFSEAKRFALASKFNALIASSAFASWLKGEPLSIGSIFGGAKPTIAIFSISHLGDKERMFFVTLILNAVLSWMRSQDGSQKLRALLYMDEIFGYFPPSANPPSKTPMMLLLKQARAFGLGAVLSTQNPVDLDYKGLSNIGAWFIGRMQSAQDCERVSAGLIGAGGSKNELSAQISALQKRRFLLKTDGLSTFDTRWTLSYLKGPLSRDQIRFLTGATRIASNSPSLTPPQSVLVLDASARKKRAAIEAKYEREKKRLLEKRSRLLTKLDKEKSDVTRGAIGLFAAIGSGLLNAVLGSRRGAANKIGGAVKSTASVQKERGDIARVNEEIAQVDRELNELESQTKSALLDLS